MKQWTRTSTKIIIAAVLLVIVSVWWHRDPRGSVVARSTSPDGRWRILVYEHKPNLLLLDQSPWIYTCSISSPHSSLPVEVDFTRNNDSSAMEDFRIVWSSDYADVFYYHNDRLARVELDKQPVHWSEAK